MNPSTYQCLSCRLKDTVKRTTSRLVVQQRPFHASSSRSTRSPSKALNPAYPQVGEAARRDIQAREEQVESLAKLLKPYTAREKELLALRYTPEQMAAIEAGEEAIDPRDMIRDGHLRGDAFRPTYIDDFATIRPLVDDAPPAILNGQPQPKPSSTSPSDPFKRSPKQKIPGGISTIAADEGDPHLLRLCQQTGLTREQIRRIRVKNLVNHRVVNQTSMGKIQSLYYLTIAGDGQGMLGIGEGKAAEDEDGRRQAMMNAIRNMRPVPRYEDRTIYGAVEAKVGAAVVQLSSRPPGFGNRCQHLIFELARAAGIQDLAARTPRSRNKMNVVKAAFEALTNQRLPDDVARSRGRKMVDVRSAYYGGQVY